MDTFHTQMEDYSFPYYDPANLTLKRYLGSGGTGKVYTGTLKVYGDVIKCIVKQISSDDYDRHHENRYMYQDIIDEVDIGHRFMGKGEHLIQFYGYSMIGGLNQTLHLIMEQTQTTQDMCEYLNKGSFWNKLSLSEYDISSSKTKMYNQCQGYREYWDYIVSVRDKFHLIKQTCLALQELHSFQVVHCDLKLNNMLYTSSTIKLIDFGASQYMDTDKYRDGPIHLGTAGYMAQEMQGGGISYQADIYSLGVCMLEIWFGDIWPTPSDDYKTCRRYVLDYLTLLKTDNPKLHSFIKRCVSTDPKKRPLINTVIANLDRIQALI
jgi:serine/threonine protein kinase